jgi:hypothetical protein
VQPCEMRQSTLAVGVIVIYEVIISFSLISRRIDEHMCNIAASDL